MYETFTMNILLDFHNLSNDSNIICYHSLFLSLSLSLSLYHSVSPSWFLVSLCSVYLSKYVLGQNRTAVWAVGNTHTQTHTQAAKNSLLLEELWSGSLCKSLPFPKYHRIHMWAPWCSSILKTMGLLVQLYTRTAIANATMLTCLSLF